MVDKTLFHLGPILLSITTCCAVVGEEKKPKKLLDTEFTDDVSQDVGSFAPSQTLLGKSVYDEAGTKIGRLDDIIIDPYTGMASTLVVIPSPNVGPGTRMLIPFNLVTPIRQLTLRVRADIEKIKGGPSIAGSRNSGPYRRQLAKVPFDYYSIKPVWGNAPLVRNGKLDDDDVFVYTKALRGSPVQGIGGDKIGELDDVAISFDNGKIAYVALEVPKANEETKPDRYAIPLGAFVAKPKKKTWMLELTRDALRSTEAISRHRPWPAEVELGWSNYVDQRYGDGMLSGVQRTLSSEKPRQ